MVSRSAVADWLEAEAARLDANGIEPNDLAQRVHAYASWARNPGMDFAQMTANARRQAAANEKESHRSFNEGVSESIAADRQNRLDVLKFHLKMAHHNEAALDLTNDEAVEQHHDEHHGPGGLRNHDGPDFLHDWNWPGGVRNVDGSA